MIAVFLALDAINGLQHRAEYQLNIRDVYDLAGYLGTVENGQTFGTLAGDRGVGTFGGSQDHTAILCARAGMLSQFGFCPVVRERDIVMPDELVFVVGVSGVVAEKTGEARERFNRASRLVSEIEEIWRTSTGRNDPTLAAAARSAPDAPQRLRELLLNQPALLDRFEQFREESEHTIPAAGDALLRGDLDSFGALVDHSQERAERLLKNQVPETIDLARMARESGAVAASAFGAGFGGSVWALIRRDDADAFRSKWQSRYLARHPNQRERAAFFTTRAGPPATLQS
jgi:galactokinase